MKKLLFVWVALIVGGARADNIVTSREYVDTQANTLQSELPAKNTNTVLLNTVTAGAPGAKAIYDASTDYTMQTDALVTAGTFNTAVQNALESEFVCIERQNGNGGCLLYEIRGAAQQRILPAGYTRLEYLESTGTQLIYTGVKATSETGVSIKGAFTDIYNYDYLFGTGDPAVYWGIDSTGTYMIASDRVYTTNCCKLYVPINDVRLDEPITLKMNFYNSGISEYVGISSIDLQDKPQFSTNATIYMFGTSPTYRGTGKIYYMQITDGNTLVRNFIPAMRDSDGKLGMYDTVTNAFFTNYSTGEFIAGPMVSSNLYLPSGN